MVQYWSPLAQQFSADIPFEVLNEHLFLLVEHYIPTKVIHEHNKDIPRIDYQCRHASGLQQKAHLRWIRDHSRFNLDTRILRVASKQLRLLHGRVGDSTIVVNSLSPQMSELVEDAIAS